MFGPAGRPPGGGPGRARVHAGSWWIRFARDERRFALIFLVVGFIAVFLQQADPILQLLVGAPIFEEALKFGLALWLAALLRVRNLAVRLVLAWLVGLAFGTLEHFWGYRDEPPLFLAHRLFFHAASTSLSIVSHRVLCRDRAVYARWGATIPAFLVHYVNNTAALVLAIAWHDRPLESVLSAIQPFLIAIASSLILLHFLVPLAGRPFRALARGTVGLLARHV